MKPSDVIALMFIFPSLMATATELKDPALRDESIAASLVSVAVMKDSSDYIYEFTIKAPLENKGTIHNFLLDLHCDHSYAPVRDDNVPIKALGAWPSSSPNGMHAPAILNVVNGNVAIWSINAANEANWMMSIAPGQQAVISVRSPFAPGYRRFTLKSDTLTHELEYDYSNVDETEEDDPLIPSAWDWYVYGVTKGPACPGNELPEEPKFSGTQKHEESEAVNALLTYSAPIQDRFHLGHDVRSYTLTVHYDKNIDPATFSVEPNNAKLRSLFHPQPESSETIEVPVTPGKNLLKLSVKAKQKINTESELNKDIDFFEARVNKP